MNRLITLVHSSTSNYNYLKKMKLIFRSTYIDALIPENKVILSIYEHMILINQWTDTLISREKERERLQIQVSWFFLSLWSTSLVFHHVSAPLVLLLLSKINCSPSFPSNWLILNHNLAVGYLVIKMITWQLHRNKKHTFKKKENKW